MQAFEIDDLKDFMGKLLCSEVFDAFLVSEADLTTFTTIHFDGTLFPDYFPDAEKENLSKEDDLVSWKLLRPIFFSLIKGKNLPLRFHIVFRLAKHNVCRLLDQSCPTFRPDDVAGLYLTLQYTNAKLTCVTGSALRIFTLDKQIDRVWDDMVRKFLVHNQIAV